MEETEKKEDSTLEASSDAPVIDDQHKFGFLEGFFLITINAVGDIFELFDLTGIGVIIGLVVDFIVGPLITLYLYLKGTPRVVSRNALAQAAEIVPYIDLLPMRTVVMILTILGTNNPERWGKYIGLANAVTTHGVSIKKNIK